ncbi:MAG: hypothetical protein EXQ79_08460 [Acidimicrobiia bacterium]|nr:hypothetical protein [Acidimicrobiia bacterium]
MNAAVLVKQVIGPGGELVMDELSGMAVAQAVELCAAVGDGMCTAIALGPEAAEAVLREAIAWGRTWSVMTDGILLVDPAFDGSDTLAAARALAAVITREGPFDLVLLGADSSDTNIGQLGPQLAELLDLPFVAAARYLSMQGSRVHVRGRHEDGWLQAVIELPAVVSCAAELTDPCDPEPAAQALVPSDLIRSLTASDLGPGPWGAAASTQHDTTSQGRSTAAVLEPGRPDLGAGDADTVLELTGSFVAEDVARAVAEWAHAATPERVLLPNTAWGREVAGRVTVRLSSDRVAIEVVRPEALLSTPRRESAPPSVQKIAVQPRWRVRIASRSRGTSPTL